jgi:hypothetical protein
MEPLDAVLDIREGVPDGRAEQDQDTDNHQGHQREDQGVLDEALAALDAEQTIQHTSPYSLDTNRDDASLCTTQERHYF